MNTPNYFTNVNTHTVTLLALILAAVGVTGFLYTEITQTHNRSILENITAAHTSQLAASADAIDLSAFPDPSNGVSVSDTTLTIVDEGVCDGERGIRDGDTVAWVGESGEINCVGAGGELGVCELLCCLGQQVGVSVVVDAVLDEGKRHYGHDGDDGKTDKL